MRYNNTIGLFPAGGKGSRIAPLPCSKEIYPVGLQLQKTGNAMRPKVAGHYLLEKMRLAGAEKAYIILRQGKWDIPAYFSDGKILDMPLAYLVVELSHGVPFTLDQAYPFVKDAMVVFGFPDILFQPDDAFIQLIDRQTETGADLVLGLFPASEPNKVDMVEMDKNGRVTGLSIKPLQTPLRYSWIIAVWTPLFTQFMHNFVQKLKLNHDDMESQSEIFLGDVIKAAILKKKPIEKVIFEHGRYLDIGTPEDMAQATALTELSKPIRSLL